MKSRLLKKTGRKKMGPEGIRVAKESVQMVETRIKAIKAAIEKATDPRIEKTLKDELRITSNRLTHFRRKAGI